MLLAFAISSIIDAHTGDVTLYDPSLKKGSCGHLNLPSHMVVAASKHIMGDRSHWVHSINSPECFKEIEIFNPNNDKTIKALVSCHVPGRLMLSGF